MTQAANQSTWKICMSTSYIMSHPRDKAVGSLQLDRADRLIKLLFLTDYKFVCERGNPPVLQYVRDERANYRLPLQTRNEKVGTGLLNLKDCSAFVVHREIFNCDLKYDFLQFFCLFVFYYIHHDTRNHSNNCIHVTCNNLKHCSINATILLARQRYISAAGAQCCLDIQIINVRNVIFLNKF